MLKRTIILVLLSLVILNGIVLGASNELNLLAWIGYVAPEVVESFETNYDAKVNVTYYNTYEEMFQMIQDNSYDLLITGELAFPILIKNGQLDNLDKSLIPNMNNMDPLFKGLSFDPGNKYSLPYHYIYIGLIYHKDRVEKSEVTLQNYFEAPAKLKNRITSFPDKRIMVSMAMKYMGESLNNQESDNLDLTKMLMDILKDNLSEQGLNMSRAVVSGYTELLNDEADIAISYVAVSTRRLFKAEGAIGFVLPQEGAIIGSDNMAIPKGAVNKELAHNFINHLYDPKIAAMSVNTFGNPFPVQGVKEMIKPEYANNPEIYPPANVVKNLEFFEPMNQEQLSIYDDIWAEVFGE